MNRFGARLAADAREVTGEALRDSSFYTLFAANAIALAIALTTDTSMPLMMAAFWAQSVIIGAVGFFRVFALPLASTEEKVVVTVLYLFIYGVLTHQFFLLVEDLGRQRGINPFAQFEFWPCAAGFAAHHVYSLWRNLGSDAEGRRGLHVLLFVPFVRVVPMLLACAVALVFSSGLLQQVVIAALKTWIDVAMHSIEHHVLHKG